MKTKLHYTLFLTFNCLLFTFHSFSQQGVAINSSGVQPHISSILDVSSTTQGMRIPRVALVSTNLPNPISSPALSLLVFDTVTVNDVFPGFYYWDGSKWVRLATGIGSAGLTGVTGFTGINGNTGAIGLTGQTGINGADGATGSDGATGANGTTGVQGVTGETGIQGTTGVTGNDGSTGIQGQTGLTGATGIGVTGTTGNTGTQGVTGETGVVGATGQTGVQGDTGVTGNDGSTGVQGQTGLTGADGATGSNGPYGGISVYSSRSASPMTWPNCAQYCYNLVESGYTDWRVPTIGELEQSWNINPLIVSTWHIADPPGESDCGTFPGIGDTYIWTSSPGTFSGNSWIIVREFGWNVWEASGGVCGNGSTYCRCVR